MRFGQIAESSPRHHVISFQVIYFYIGRSGNGRGTSTRTGWGPPKTGTLPRHVPLAVNTVVKARCVREIIVRRCFSEMMLSEMF